MSYIRTSCWYLCIRYVPACKHHLLGFGLEIVLLGFIRLYKEEALDLS
jgi:hypothetical protein